MKDKINRLDDVYKVFKEQPLQIDELDRYYVENYEARGGAKFRNRISRRLTQGDSGCGHILFIGYKGCGKSTELNRLQKDIQNNYLVINFSVSKELDPIKLNYIELFIVLMERLFAIANAEDSVIEIKQEYLENINKWIATREIKEIKDKYIGADIEGGAEGKYGIPFLHNFFYKLKMSAKSSTSFKETLKTNIEPRLSDLIEHCNDLIREIYLQLDKVGRENILIIIEDIDKLPFSVAHDLFFNYVSSLTQLRTNIIFTFPIALYHHPQFNTIKQYFDDRVELPMIMVRNRDSSDNSAGKQLMRSIVEQRMEVATLFKEPEALDDLIKLCGGVIRDLFRLIREAADSALDMGRVAMEDDDILNAINNLKREYENNIADYDTGDKQFTAEEYYDALIKLEKSETCKLDNTDVELHLRQNLSILGYNGEGWYSIHPVIRKILKERKRI